MDNIRKIEKSEYPLQLREIGQLPESMNIVGNMPDETHKFLCVIGSRSHTSYGKEVCDRIISGLKGHPIAIVSGLAIGIDSLAHESALKAELKTIAFPGSGLSREALYPYSRRDLAHRIVSEGGAVISPFEHDQPGLHWTFPFRNRLMAGISHAVLVIEGGHGSGTLLTAGYATEFGRDIMAVPGSVFSELSYGPNILIRDGAIVITDANDALRALGFTVDSNVKKDFINFAELQLSPEEKRIIAILQFSPASAGTIIDSAALSASTFNIHISSLELQGVVVEEQGVYRLKR